MRSTAELSSNGRYKFSTESFLGVMILIRDSTAKEVLISLGAWHYRFGLILVPAVASQIRHLSFRRAGRFADRILRRLHLTRALDCDDDHRTPE
jgi:hypothetical protein